MRGGEASPLLVLGFGPFLDVVDNPASRLARAVDGSVIAGSRVYGREMPVSYEASVALSRRLVDELQPALVLGVGVAVKRTAPELERYGRRVSVSGRPDVSGRVRPPELLGAPECLESRLPLSPMARAMGASVSEDAGRYVCNSWLYQALHQLHDVAAVGFLHVPSSGLSPERLVEGLKVALAWSREGSALG